MLFFGLSSLSKFKNIFMDEYTTGTQWYVGLMSNDNLIVFLERDPWSVYQSF